MRIYVKDQGGVLRTRKDNHLSFHALGILEQRLVVDDSGHGKSWKTSSTCLRSVIPQPQRVASDLPDTGTRA